MTYQQLQIDLKRGKTAPKRRCGLSEPFLTLCPPPTTWISQFKRRFRFELFENSWTWELNRAEARGWAFILFISPSSGALELKAPGPPGLLNYNLQTPRQVVFFLSSSRHECAKRGTFQVSIEPKHHRTRSTRSYLLFRYQSRRAGP